MTPFITIFSLITLVSVLTSGALLLMRRKGKGRWRDQEHIHSAVFSFFTTLYAFFIGFAMVTLWTAFLAAKNNVTREADSMMIVYRTATHMPNSGPFRQAVVGYVKAVIDSEWAEMEKGAMSPEALQRFDDIWDKFYELVPGPNKAGELYTNLTEAARQRSFRGSVLQGNIYQPIWAILIFGFLSVVYGLYFINRAPTLVSLIYEFMVIFLVLACIWFIYDLDTPFSGVINVSPDAFRGVYQKMLSMP